MLTTVCAAHLLESCHKCGMLSIPVNEDARGRMEAKKNSKKPMKKSMLPKGTVFKTQMEDRPDFVAVIGGWMMGNPNLACGGKGNQLCYILHRKESNLDNEEYLEGIEDEHTTWQLVDMSFDQVRKIAKETGFSQPIPITEDDCGTEEELS